MGNRQRKKDAAAAFNAKRIADIEERARKDAEYRAWAESPEGRAEIRNGRRRIGIITYAAIAIGAFR